jgi:hypothetical protein
VARNPQIVVEYVAKTAELKSSLDDAAKSTGRFSDKLKGIAKGGAIAAGAAGIGGLVATLKVGVGEWQESTKIAAQTGAVIKSTGGAAKVTAGHVSTLAESLMKKSGVDDEAIASGENLLLTFTNIRNEAGKGNDVFDQTTKAALDMSVALGTDMKASAMQLGKALNDPIKGVSKLTKQGVTFTEAQKEQIKTLTEHGRALDAQKIILAEVTKEFGGSAEAAGKTLPGQLNILRETFNNLAGALVGKLIPVLQDTIAWLRDHWPDIVKAFNSFWDSVQPILQNLWALLQQVADVLVASWPALEPIVRSFGKQVQDVAKVIANAIKLVTDIMRGDWSAAWEDAKRILAAALDFFKQRITMVLDPIKAAATALGKAIINGIQDGLTGLVAWIGERMTAAKNAVIGVGEAIYTGALSVGRKILTGFVDGMTGLYTEVTGRVSGAVNAVDNFIATAGTKARAVGAAIKDGLVDGLTGLANLVKGAIEAALNAVIHVWNSFKIPGIKIKGHRVTGDIRLPQIPALAEGGVVTSPTLAMIGEAGPEMVVPLTGSASPAVEVRVFIGDTELRGLVRTEIIDSDTGIARTLLAGAALMVITVEPERSERCGWTYTVPGQQRPRLLISRTGAIRRPPPSCDRLGGRHPSPPASGRGPRLSRPRSGSSVTYSADSWPRTRPASTSTPKPRPRPDPRPRGRRLRHVADRSGPRRQQPAASRWRRSPSWSYAGAGRPSCEVLGAPHRRSPSQRRRAQRRTFEAADS